MATLTFSFDTSTIPLSTITTAFASQYNYQSTLPDGSLNPENQAQFTRRMVMQYIVSVVQAYNIKLAQQQAQSLNPPIILT